MLLCEHELAFISPEIDNEGVIEPDTDDPQEMGDYENLEVNAVNAQWAFYL